MLVFYHNGPNITNQSFALPKEHVKAKLQRFEKSGQTCQNSGFQMSVIIIKLAASYSG